MEVLKSSGFSHIIEDVKVEAWWQFDKDAVGVQKQQMRN